MSNTSRLQAISQITTREPMKVKMTDRLGKIWADDVFNLARMEWALSKNAFKEVKNTVQSGAPLDAATAVVVSAAMIEWAVS